MDCYLVVVQAPAYRVREGVFATESAFAGHLRMLRDRLVGRHFDRLLVAAPQLPEETYAAQKDSLAHVDELEERIEYVPLHPITRGKLGFWRQDARRAWGRLRAAVKRSAVVHSGLADDLWRPTMLFANVASKLSRKPLLFFVDIDFRNDTEMYRETGVWSGRTYWMNKLVYDPLKLAQVHLAPFYADLVLLKSGRMVRDVGRGRGHVRNFFDTAHSESQVIDDATLDARVERMRDRSRPLQFVFFGRFVEYKGLDRSIRALGAARARSGRDLRMELIGRGEERAKLEALVRELDLGSAVRFRDPLPYGPELFAALAESDVQLATPLCEDTPRAAFDAMAQGMPIAAFGINYYRDLEEQSGAVRTATWPDPDALAELMIALDEDRDGLAAMARAGVAFARENTQDRWLDQRIAWTLALLER